MEANLKYRVGLNLLFGEKLHILKKINRVFPQAADVFNARFEDLTDLGVEADTARELLSPRLRARAEAQIARHDKLGYKILTIEHEDYPNYLREIYDPPDVLYYAGDKGVLAHPAVAVVGARKPTAYGRAVAERLAEDLASRGIVVVSGLARGIDALAHWGALKGGKTVAVLGSGLDVVYPDEHKKLFDRIVDQGGAVLTEYPLKTQPLAFHFPLRNRIVSGLSLAVVVIEAARRSGSLISARLALEQDREVMAVPGNITSRLSWGTNWLIKTGAKPVTDWQDVAEELPPDVRAGLLSSKTTTAAGKVDLPASEKLVYELLSPDSLTHIDEIVEKLGLSVSEGLTLLLSLELKELITQCPGKYFQRKL